METGSPEVGMQRMKKQSMHTPMKWKQPTACYQESPKSSLLFSAQARSYEKKIKIVKRIKNPFDPEDPTIFEENTCSPGILKTGPESDEFSWSIDEISKIQPVTIDSPLTPEMYDEAKEKLAQQAIQKYFSFTHSIVSPEDAYQGTWKSPAFSTPTAAPGSAKTISSTPTSKPRIVYKCDVGVQTACSFPPVLPPDLEAIFKQYTQDTNEGNVETEESNLLNTSTLRRKLFFNRDDEDLSPVKFDSRFVPTPEKTDKLSRLDWSMDKNEGSIPSSPDLTPIKFGSMGAEMSLGSQNYSMISVQEVSMATAEGSVVNNEIEEMVVSIDGHNRIFSSTVVNNKDDRSAHNTESGYITSDGISGQAFI